jgi:hypothetical protein
MLAKKWFSSHVENLPWCCTTYVATMTRIFFKFSFKRSTNKVTQLFSKYEIHVFIFRTSVWIHHHVKTMDCVTLTTITTTILAFVMELKEETARYVSCVLYHYIARHLEQTCAVGVSDLIQKKCIGKLILW